MWNILTIFFSNILKPLTEWVGKLTLPASLKGSIILSAFITATTVYMVIDSKLSTLENNQGNIITKMDELSNDIKGKNDMNFKKMENYISLENNALLQDIKIITSNMQKKTDESLYYITLFINNLSIRDRSLIDNYLKTKSNTVTNTIDTLLMDKSYKVGVKPYEVDKSN